MNRRTTLFSLFLLLAAGACPPARAAFDLGDASPGSLGAVSLEGPRRWLLPERSGDERPGGDAIAFSHASLFAAPDLAANSISVVAARGPVAAEFGALFVGAGPLRERMLRLSLSERRARAVSLRADLDRLDLLLPDARSHGGWAASVGAVGRWHRGPCEGTIEAAASRAARSEGLAALGVRPELELRASIVSGGLRLAAADRRGTRGEGSPRVTVEIPLGATTRLRVGRGSAPARVGVAFAVRRGNWLVSVGRLDDASAATISAVEIGYARRSDAKRPAEAAGRSSESRAGCPEAPSDLLDVDGSARQPAMAPTTPSLAGATPLWGANPSAIMRRHSRIGRRLGLAPAVLFAPASAAAEGPVKSIEYDHAESSAAWLPDPVETMDAPERRDEPPEGWRVRAQAGWGGATPAVRRIWWVGGECHGLEEAAISSGPVRADGGTLWRAGALQIGAGALAIPNFGLPGETAALVRRQRGFGAGGASPRDHAARAAPGTGADLGGVALAWRDAIRVAFGGLRRAEGDALAIEVRHEGSAARCVLVRRETRTVAHGGFAIAAGRPANRVALEAAASPEGATARIDAAARAGPIRGAARWRYEQGRVRPGTLDLEAAWVARDAAARFRWRSWSQGGAGGTVTSGAARGGADDGRAEVDLRAGRGGVGALMLRLGTRPKQADGTGGERYTIGDLVVARESGRTLRLTAGDRFVQAGEGWRRGRAIGAVLEIERRRRASFALTAEAVRAEDGAGSYGPGLDVAGGGSLRASTRTGLRAAARGWIALGAWRCGMAVDDEDVGSADATTAGEARAPRVNLWLAWSGGSEARQAPRTPAGGTMRYAERMNLLGTETAFEVLAKARALEAQGRSIVHLEIGEPDFDTPTPIRDAAIRAIQEGFTHYGPSAGLPEVKEAIAAHISKDRGLKVTPDQVVITPGGKPVITFSILATVDPGDEVIVPDPGFPIYESVVRFAGAKPVPMVLREERNFQFGAADLEALLTPKTKMVVLNSPHNPTGSVLTPKDLDEIGALLRDRDIWVLSDEIYSKILYEGVHESIATRPGMAEKTILLDGFSKTYAMTGWRLGYGVMPPALAKHVARLATNVYSHATSFVQRAAPTALGGSQDEVVAMVSEFRRRREAIVTGLNAIPGVTCAKPAGAFYVFPNVRGLGMKSADVETALLQEAGIAALSGTAFGAHGEGYIRFSYANSIGNIQEGLRRFETFVQSHARAAR